MLARQKNPVCINILSGNIHLSTSFSNNTGRQQYSYVMEYLIDKRIKENISKVANFFNEIDVSSSYLGLAIPKVNNKNWKSLSKWNSC